MLLALTTSVLSVDHTQDDALLQDPDITDVLNPLLYEALLYNAYPEVRPKYRSNNI